MRLFLCGDVMLGRGIDQVLPFPGDPELFEYSLRSAAGYVRLAEEVNGPIPRPADFAYVWGDALAEMARREAGARIINLETSITAKGSPWPGKGINYRMHPLNAISLAAAGIDVGVLSNNHVMDWGMEGLLETLETLDRLGIQHAGAGRNLSEARAPATVDIASGDGKPKGRVLVFGLGSETSGIPLEWAAGPGKPGLYLLESRPDLLAELATNLEAARSDQDIAIASIHWGGNWGYEVPDWQIELAHRLVDEAGFDMVHGHSSHHVKALEVYRGRPILYGCGDFLNDYEGIGGFEEFRPDLGLMYFPEWEESGHAFSGMRMIPMQTRRFQTVRASHRDARWLEVLLNGEGLAFGTRVTLDPDDTLTLARQ